MRDLIVFSRAIKFDLIIKGDKAARDACAEISPFFGLVGRTVIAMKYCRMNEQHKGDDQADGFYFTIIVFLKNLIHHANLATFIQIQLVINS